MPLIRPVLSIRPHRTPRVTARRMLALLGVVVLGMSIAACGSSGEKASAQPSTRVVDTVKGKVTVPSHPKRIVSVHVSSDSTLYDLGMKPVGVADPGESYISPRYLATWKGATKVFSGGEIHLEKIAALHPDLIIGVDWPFITEHYADLSKIAPTVIAPSTTWQATANGVADAVNRHSGLSKLKKEVGSRSAQIKADYADKLAHYKWDILQGGFDVGNFWLYGPNAELGPILSGAGVQFASATTSAASSQKPAAGIRALSYERIGLLSDADVIGFYSNFDGTPNNQGPQLFGQKLWKELPAVKAGRLVPFPNFLPSGYGDALDVLNSLEAGLKKIGNAS